MSTDPLPDGATGDLRYVDTHCHLDHHRELSVDEQVEAARSAGVRTLVTIGTNMADSTQAVQTAMRHDGVWAAVGIHPNDAMEATEQVLEVIDTLAQQEGVVGIGETGLDYYRDHTTPAQQEASFRAHIEMARRHDQTLVIHCRDAWPDLLDCLEDAGPPQRVVMHCFSGGPAVVERCIEAGYFMSFAGNVTFTNADELRQAAAKVPVELLLTETDSPFLTPHPHRGEANDPSFVPLVLAQLAEVHGSEPASLARHIEDNARRAFALPDPATAAA